MRPPKCLFPPWCADLHSFSFRIGWGRVTVTIAPRTRGWPVTVSMTISPRTWGWPQGQTQKGPLPPHGRRGPLSCSHTGWRVSFPDQGAHQVGARPVLHRIATGASADPHVSAGIEVADQPIAAFRLILSAPQVPAPVGPGLLALVPARVPGTRAAVSPGGGFLPGPSDSTGSPPRAVPLRHRSHALLLVGR